MVSFLDNEKITSSYLSKQELLYYDYLKNSENIIQNKKISFSDQTKEFLIQYSDILNNSELEESPKKPSEKTSSDHLIRNESEDVLVIFLKDINRFVYIDNRIFGPYKKNEVDRIPKDIFTKILQPKNFAQLKLE